MVKPSVPYNGRNAASSLKLPRVLILLVTASGATASSLCPRGSDVYDLLAAVLDAPRRVAGIKAPSGMLPDKRVVDDGVVGHDQDAVVRPQDLFGQRDRAVDVIVDRQDRDMRIVIADPHVRRCQQLNDLQRGRGP